MQSTTSIVMIKFAGFLLTFYLFTLACKKETHPSIAGKWQIVNDSTRFIGNASNSSWHADYIGQPGDFYDFRSNGMMYVKEGPKLDSMAYEVSGNNQVGCVPAPGFTSTYQTSFISQSNSTLIVSGNTAAGQLNKIVNLRR